MKLAIVTTHPIQYNAPWFKMLAEQNGIDVKVFYTWEQSIKSPKYDPGFGKVIEWDIPLLDGYEYTFVKNVSDSPGSHHYKGIDNPTLNEEVSAWGAEAVLVIGWPFKSHLSCMKYFKCKIPVLFRGDSTLLNERSGIKKVIRRISLRYIYSNVDYALYVGTNNKEYFLAHGLKEKQLVFVPHAIDNKRFFDIDGNYELMANEWRRELGIDDSNVVLLYAGKFDKVKNPSYILDIAEQMTDEKYRFILVGNGPLEKELKERSENDHRVMFVDFQNQQKMPVVYRLADYFVLSSNSETWGLGVNEALASGRRVITNSNVGCAVDMIKENNGIIVNPGDVNDVMIYVGNSAGQPITKDILETYSFDTLVSNLTTLIKTLKS
ncbi:MAG: glycosyltransferase family 4 protein [Chitinophagales bacterium]|nr:glycosyltransferase family 4 protein [Chitinophagaceae bacterium]MCB9064652.1 glycosyltransferase family 4 protein [Chitinophagales bacterium]